MMTGCKYKILSLSNHSNFIHNNGHDNSHYDPHQKSLFMFYESAKQSLVNNLAKLINDLRTLQYQRISSHHKQYYNFKNDHENENHSQSNSNSLFSSFTPSFLSQNFQKKNVKDIIKDNIKNDHSTTNHHSVLLLEQYEENQDNFKEIKDRELGTMLQGMQEIADTFHHIQQMTIEQASLLGRIDYNVEQARDNVTKAKDRITRANKLDSNTLMWRQMVLIFLLSLIFILGFMISHK